MNQLLVELFSGVMIDTYMSLRGIQTGLILLTDRQRLWMENMRVALITHSLSLQPRPPALPAWLPQPLARLQRFLFRAVHSRAKDIFFAALTVANLAVMALTHAGQGEAARLSLWRLECVFTALFVLEAALKMAGLGPLQYVRSWESRFDAVCAACSVLSLALWGSALGTLLRAMRVGRLARYANNKGLLRLIHTLVLALPGMANATCIMTMNLFIWAVVGMNLFAGARYGSMGFFDQLATGASALGNFDDFPRAFLMCFRCITGENYNGVMRELMLGPPYCVPTGEPGANCPEPAYAAAFFVGLYTVTTFIVCHIVVAIVMEAFSLTSEESTDRFGSFRLNTEAADQFLGLWATYDVEGRLQLDAGSIALVLCDLPYPLGLKGDPRLAAHAAAAAAGAGAAGALQKPPPPLPQGGGRGGGRGPGHGKPPEGLVRRQLRRAVGSLRGMWNLDHTREAGARRKSSRLRIPLETQLLASDLFERLGLAPNIHNRYSYYTVLHALIDRATLGAPLSTVIRSSGMLRATIIERRGGKGAAAAQGGGGAPAISAATEERFSLLLRRSVVALQRSFRALLAARGAARAAGDQAELLRLSTAARRAAVAHDSD